MRAVKTGVETLVRPVLAAVPPDPPMEANSAIFSFESAATTDEGRPAEANDEATAAEGGAGESAAAARRAAIGETLRWPEGGATAVPDEVKGPTRGRLAEAPA